MSENKTHSLIKMSNMKGVWWHMMSMNGR